VVRKFDRLSLFNTERMNVWSSASGGLHIFVASCLIKLAMKCTCLLNNHFFLLLCEVSLAFLLLLTAVRSYRSGVHVFSIRVGTSHLSADNFIMFSSIVSHNLISDLQSSAAIL
jgi:hypothetical protein